MRAQRAGQLRARGGRLLQQLEQLRLRGAPGWAGGAGGMSFGLTVSRGLESAATPSCTPHNSSGVRSRPPRVLPAAAHRCSARSRASASHAPLPAAARVRPRCCSRNRDMPSACETGASGAALSNGRVRGPRPAVQCRAAHRNPLLSIARGRGTEGMSAHLCQQVWLAARRCGQQLRRQGGGVPVPRLALQGLERAAGAAGSAAAHRLQGAPAGSKQRSIASGPRAIHRLLCPQSCCSRACTRCDSPWLRGEGLARARSVSEARQQSGAGARLACCAIAPASASSATKDF